MKNTAKKLFLGALWIIFIAMLVVISYLSLQSGQAAKNFDKEFLQGLVSGSDGGNMAKEKLDALIYIIRQSGRAIAFFSLGMVGTLTAYLSFPRCHWIVKTGIAVVFLLAVACLTEKLKVYIPTRHYSYDEMMISVTAVTVGFLVVLIIMLIGRAIKGMRRIRRASR